MKRLFDRRRIVVLMWLGTAASVFAGCRSAIQPPSTPVCARVTDPYARPGTWYRGNFHMHSRHSDGTFTAEQLVDLYREHDYRVLCISDHNHYGDQDGGIVPECQADSLLHDWNGDGVLHPEHVFGSGVEAYARDWTKAPPKWMRDQWIRQGEDVSPVPILITGAEMSYVGWHVCLVDIPSGPLQGPEGGFDSIARAHDSGAFVFLAHPGEWNGAPARLVQLLDLRKFDGIEIMNGLRLTASNCGPPRAAASGFPNRDADCGTSLPPDATPLWDALLTRGYKLWALANDDEHTWVGAPHAYPFTAFNVLLAEAPTRDGFMRALHDGSFYCSTGLYFRDVGIRGDSLIAWVPGAQRVTLVGPGGRLVAEVAGTRLAYRPKGTDRYLRVQATGVSDGTPWAPAVWSQPFFVEGVPCSSLSRSPDGG